MCITTAIQRFHFVILHHVKVSKNIDTSVQNSRDDLKDVVFLAARGQP